MVSSRSGLPDLKDSSLPPLENLGGVGESGLDLEPSLLEAIGLDKSQLNLSGAIHTSEPDLGDLSLGKGVAEHTELKLHERGWVQFGVMGAAVGMVTVFAGTFLSQSFGIGRESEQGAKDASQVGAKTGAEERGFVSPEESKDAELSRLRAERAIVDQQYQSRLLEIQRQQQLSAQVNANSNVDSKADQSSPSSSSPSTVTAVVPPPPVVEVPPPTTIVPEAPDLRQQWQTAQELWTLQQQFGSFSGKAVGNPLRTELSARPDVPFQPSDPNFSNSESSSQPTRESTAPVSGNKPSSVPSTSSSQSVALLEEQQAFLAGKIYDSNNLAEGPVQVASAKINAGTQIEGVIKTPIIFIEGDQEAGNRSFTIELTEGLDLGAMKIPAGSVLLAEVSTVAANGVMFLAGSVLITPEGEVELPEGIVEIRGHQGKPLMANLINRGQAAEMAKGLGAMVVGGVREAANLYNRPDQQTIITDNQTIVTNRQPKKNYSAATISGALTEITPRVQDALRPAAGRNPARVWQIPAGRKVNILFRRSLTMEIAQS